MLSYFADGIAGQWILKQDTELLKTDASKY